MTTENFDYYQAEQDISYYKEKIWQLQNALDMGVDFEYRAQLEKSIEFAMNQILRIRLAMVLDAEHNLTLLN
jgi:hypothetical protein